MVKIRVGVIGLGEAWETRHKPALRALGDRFEVRAVCAEVGLFAEQAAREFHAAQVDGFRALAMREDIDAVMVLSPDWYGVLPILAACDSGKAVYAAAAWDFDLERAAEVKKRVDQSGVVFMAEFPRRHSPATLRLKELIATCLGQPQLLFCHERTKVAESHNGRNGLRKARSTSRDLMELADWCRYIVGKDPSSVVSVRHRGPQPADEDDYVMMSLDFSAAGQTGLGPLAQISCGRYVREDWQEAISFRPPSQLQVCCEQGVAFADLPASLVWFDEAGRHMESLESERPVGERLLAHFHRAVTSLVRKTDDLEDAFRALEIVLRAADSRTQGGRIELSGSGGDG